MPTGVEHVEAALAHLQRASDAVGAPGGGSAEAVARMETVAVLLRETTDRFYLKTRVGVPFARKCEEAAGALAELVGLQGPNPAPNAQQQREAALDAALVALEKAAATLDERSRMQGMAIT